MTSLNVFFVKEFSDGTKIFLLNYVDDMLYYGTDTKKVKEFEEQIGERFNLELLGQAHWYLGTRICQLANYLDTAGCPKNNRRHKTTLAIDFIPTSDNCSTSKNETKKLSEEFNVDFASCVGSLIYLGMTHMDISYAVNKLVKYTRQPGRKHVKALIHLL